MVSLAPVCRWNFDIDAYLNPFLAASPLPSISPCISHFLGYRKDKEPAPPLGNVVVVFWASIGIFSSVAIIQLVGHQVLLFDNGPTIINSLVSAGNRA